MPTEPSREDRPATSPPPIPQCGNCRSVKLTLVQLGAKVTVYRCETCGQFVGIAR